MVINKKIDTAKTLAAIRGTRKKKGISQRQMAVMLRISITGYHKIEKGTTSMSLERLNQIAEALDEKPLRLMQFEPAIQNLPPLSQEI